MTVANLSRFPSPEFETKLSDWLTDFRLLERDKRTQSNLQQT